MRCYGLSCRVLSEINDTENKNVIIFHKNILPRWEQTTILYAKRPEKLTIQNNPPLRESFHVQTMKKHEGKWALFDGMSYFKLF